MAIIEDINEVQRNIRNARKSTRDKIGEEAFKIVEPIFDKIDDLKDDLETWMGKQFTRVKRVVTTAVDIAIDQIKALRNGISGLKNTLKGLIKSFNSSIQSSISGMKNLATSIVNKVVSKVTNVITTAFDIIKNFLSNAVRIVGKKLDIVRNAIVDFKNFTIAKLKKLGEDITKSVKNGIESLIKGIKEGLQDLIGIFKVVVDYLMDKIKSALNFSEETVIGMFNEFNTLMAEDTVFLTRLNCRSIHVSRSSFKSSIFSTMGSTILAAFLPILSLVLFPTFRMSLPTSDISSKIPIETNHVRFLVS